MKLAVCLGGCGLEPAGEVARRMAAVQQLGEGQTLDVREVHGGAIGRVSTSDARASIPSWFEDESGDVLAISGVPVCPDGRTESLLRSVIEHGGDRAAGMLTQLDGAFAAVHWDAAVGRLTIVTDFLGFQSLYVHRRAGLVLLASEIKAFPASGCVDAQPDVGGWGAFIAFGNCLGQRTQLAGVERLEGGCIYTYTPADDDWRVTRYWDWPQRRCVSSLDEVDLGALAQRLGADMRALSEYHPGGTLLLSGGFDSRLNLAMLHAQGRSARAVVIQHPGHMMDAEGRLAVRAAGKLNGGDVEMVVPSPRFHSSPGYLRFLVRNEVATPSLSLFIAVVASYVRPCWGAVWEGLGLGHLLNAGSYPTPSFDEYLRRQQLRDDQPNWMAARRVFEPGLVEAMHAAAVRDTQSQVQRLRDAGYDVWRFIVENRARHRTGPNPLKVYANDALPLTPGLSRQAWEQVAHVPFELRRGNRLYMELLRRHFPRALEVPFCTEKGIRSARRVDPAVWVGNLVGGWSYYAGRVARLPAVARLLPRRQPGRGGRSLLDDVLRQVNPDEPGLDADAVVRLRQDRSGDAVTIAARRLLFYRQVWQWVVTGRLTTANAEAFCAGLQPGERMEAATCSS